MTASRIVPALVLPILLSASVGCTRVAAPDPTPRPAAPVAAPAPPVAPAPAAALPAEPAPAITEMAGGSTEAEANAETDAEDGTGTPTADPAADPDPPRTTRPRPRAESGAARPPRSGRTGSQRGSNPVRTDPCDALAANGIFPFGGATHRWCHRKEGLR
ncbi:hypothetical protein [Embleya sp. NPDC020886]|uniref:hypothetical protein n=1 Tax=Embleya sp. NPDC020886 TaxID=3363980 RepID=UPI00378A2BCF